MHVGTGEAFGGTLGCGAAAALLMGPLRINFKREAYMIGSRQHARRLSTSHNDQSIAAEVSLPHSALSSPQHKMDITLEMVEKTPPGFDHEPKFSQQEELSKDLTWSGESVPRLRSTNETDPEIPGQPLLSVSDEEKVLEFLARDLCHGHLNRLYPIFWLVSTPRSDHISALHEQIVKGREIVVTEDPGLHLLWYYDRVFIKPLPPYLTSHAFWKEFLCRESSVDLRKAALGYMRSYCHLIKSQSDVNVAEEKKLIPKGVDAKALLRFLHSFASVSDGDVTPRYKYGELRLSRINLYIRFYERRLFYRKMQWQYSDYLNGLVAPFVFTFALVSTALSAMQVVLAAQQPNGNQSHGWQKFTSVSQWSAVVFLILIAMCTLFFPFLVGILLFRELFFALGCRCKVGRTLQQTPGPQSEHHQPKVN